MVGWNSWHQNCLQTVTHSLPLGRRLIRIRLHTWSSRTSDSQTSIISWNVQGLSSLRTGLIKCRRLRTHLKTIQPWAGVVFIQEYKLSPQICDTMETFGMRRGGLHGVLWNAAVLNRTSNRYRRGNAILLNSTMKCTIVNSRMLVAGRAQWIICTINNSNIGFLNIYAPNRGRDWALFWDTTSQNLPAAHSWIIWGDFNTVELGADRSGNSPKKLQDEQAAWLFNDYEYRGSLPFSWSNKQDDGSHCLAWIDRFYMSNWTNDGGGQLRTLIGFGTLSDHLSSQLVIHKQSRNEADNRQFCFNTTSLDDIIILDQLKTQ